jgi:signal peptidase
VATAAILLLVIYLTSGMFRYYSLTIGSNSMAPEIRKGDIIIVHKIEDAKKPKIKTGRVLVFKQSEKTVVHRLIRKAESNGKYYYYTKGDNNNSEDAWVVPTEDVIGIATIKIPFIGWPTVLLSELVYQSK